MAYNKTVWENLPSTNTPLNETNLNKIEDELEELDGGYILESGSNANGNYIKFSDGTMVCYGIFTANIALNIAYGSAYRSDDQTINFPQNFINTNYSFYLQGRAPIHICYGTSTRVDKIIFIPVGFISQTASNKSVDYFVVGKWK